MTRSALLLMMVTLAAPAASALDASMPVLWTNDLLTVEGPLGPTITVVRHAEEAVVHGGGATWYVVTQWGTFHCRYGDVVYAQASSGFGTAFSMPGDSRCADAGAGEEPRFWIDVPLFTLGAAPAPSYYRGSGVTRA